MVSFFPYPLSLSFISLGKFFSMSTYRKLSSSRFYGWWGDQQYSLGLIPGNSRPGNPGNSRQISFPVSREKKLKFPGNFGKFQPKIQGKLLLFQWFQPKIKLKSIIIWLIVTISFICDQLLIGFGARKKSCDFDFTSEMIFLKFFFQIKISIFHQIWP